MLPLHRHAAALGMLDVAVLMVGESAGGVLLQLCRPAGTFTACGWDTIRRQSWPEPGKILLYEMIEDSFRRGDVEYCFGPGRQPYKDRFATEMRHAYTFRHYSRGSLRSQMLQLRERVYERLMSPQAVIDKGLVT